MLISFDDLETTVIPNFYGGEQSISAKMSVDPLNKILLGKLEPGASIGLHEHKTSSEIIYFLEGEGTVLFDGHDEAVTAGACHYCPKGHKHSLMNTGKSTLVFFAVVPEQ